MNINTTPICILVGRDIQTEYLITMSQGVQEAQQENIHVKKEDKNKDIHIKYTDIDEIRYLRDSIESMNDEAHNEIFKILKKHNISFSENTNGIFVNLTEVDEPIINEIHTYVKYMNSQEKDLLNVENQKKEYEDKYFVK
jgi:hypothetical protein